MNVHRGTGVSAAVTVHSFVFLLFYIRCISKYYIHCITKFSCRCIKIPTKYMYKQEAQRATYRATEYNVPPFWGIGQDGHFCLLIGMKNTNLVEDVQILLPVKFCWILFSSYRGEVENVSANQRPGRPSRFSDRPEKHKLGRGRWDHASYQVWLNSVQQLQRRSRKCLSKSEARAAILFSDRPEKHKLGRGRWDLASFHVSLNSVQQLQRRSQKCLNQSEARAAILFFRSARKTQTW